MSSNNYVIKTVEEGVKVVAINDLESKQFSIKHLLDAKEIMWNLTDSLQLQITDSSIIIATTHNEKVDGKKKKTVKMMRVPFAEI
jgi:hypothetical protein